jgi:uncharacterized protein HemX
MKYLPTILVVLFLALPLFYVFYKDTRPQANQLAKIDSVLMQDAKNAIQHRKHEDSLQAIINQQDSIIRYYETRYKTVSQRTTSIRSKYDSIVIDRPRY